MIKMIYIAGPYRASNAWEIEMNIREAETYALHIWRLGNTAVICPHANTRYFYGAAPDDLFIEGGLEILKRCDAIFMLPKWEQSEGSVEEKREAIRCSIPVFYSLYGLIEWLRPFRPNPV